MGTRRIKVWKRESLHQQDSMLVSTKEAVSSKSDPNIEVLCTYTTTRTALICKEDRSQ